RRRRHTRFSRDWSSDVCSSDLGDGLHGVRAGGEVARTPRIRRQVKETAMFSYYIKLAALSIRRNPVLSALMMLAIAVGIGAFMTDRKSTRLNSSHVKNSYAVVC